MAFRDGKLYTISCVGDGQILDLGRSSTADTADIVTWTTHGGDNQIWLATKAVVGWRLSSLIQDPENSDPKGLKRKCLDANLKTGQIIHSIRKIGLSLNHHWFVQKVNYTKMGIVRIVNVASNKCLTSHGFGKSVTCEIEDPKNTRQHWLINQVGVATLNSYDIPKVSNKDGTAQLAPPLPQPRRTLHSTTPNFNSHRSSFINTDITNKLATQNHENGQQSGTMSPQCVHCHLRQIDCVFYSCGHMCLCFECGNEHYRSNENRNCPICQAHIKDVIQTITVIR